MRGSVGSRKRRSVVPNGVVRNPGMPELYIVAEKPLYDAIRLFLGYIDQLAPEVREELSSLRILFTDDIREILYSTLDTFVAGYTVLRGSGDKACIDLADALLQWAQQFNLVDGKLVHLRYIEIALQWLELDSQLTSDLREVGEQIYLTDAIQFDPSLNSQLFKESSGLNYWGGYGEVAHPFVFSPPPVYPRLSNLPALYVQHDDKPFKTLAPLGYPDSANRVVGEMSVILDYERWKSSLLADLDSPHTKEKGPGAAKPSRGRAWNPSEEKWTDFAEEMKMNFEIYLQAYKQVVLESEAYTEVKEKKKPKHFEWLVRFQVQKWTQEEIVERYRDPSEDKDPITVRRLHDALKTTAGAVDITMRTSKST